MQGWSLRTMPFSSTQAWPLNCPVALCAPRFILLSMPRRCSSHHSVTDRLKQVARRRYPTASTRRAVACACANMRSGGGCSLTLEGIFPSAVCVRRKPNSRSPTITSGRATSAWISSWRSSLESFQNLLQLFTVDLHQSVIDSAQLVWRTCCSMVSRMVSIISNVLR